MVRTRRLAAQRLHALLGRLRDVGYQRLMHEVLELPAALSRPVARLAAVLHVPPVLLGAALAALLGSAILAVSWILTALILTVTRTPCAVDDEPCNVDDGDNATLSNARGGAGGSGDGRSSPGVAGGKSASPVNSWPLRDEVDTDDEATDGGGDAMVGGGIRRRGPRVKPATGTEAAEASLRGAHARVSAWARPVPASLSAAAQFPVRPPFLDEQQAEEVRCHVSRAAAVIPATAAEAARTCDAVFGLRLGATGYLGVLLPERQRGGTAAASAAASAAGLEGIAEVVEGEREGQAAEGGAEGAEAGLPQEGTAALGRLALHAHLARYLYGMHGGGAGPPAATAAEAAAEAAEAAEAEGTWPGDAGRAVAAAASASGAAAGGDLAASTSAAVLADLAAFVQPAVLAGLARRLRLDLLMAPASAAAAPPLAMALTAAAAGGGAGIKNSPRAQALRRAMARGGLDGSRGAAAAPPPLPPPAALAAALLRLVWEAHVSDPVGAWLAVCVLAGLARELRLVSGQAE